MTNFSVGASEQCFAILDISTGALEMMKMDRYQITSSQRYKAR